MYNKINRYGFNHKSLMANILSSVVFRMNLGDVSIRDIVLISCVQIVRHCFIIELYFEIIFKNE